ncbi:MAG: DUF1015 domain-containing protein [Dehalococcoidia bacterium]|nr:DUF1015 domain-containing protein [Dehalococcoidia bacterium]
MAEVRPLCGVRYNREKVPDLAAVLCPPYDIISPAGQRALYERSPYNFVRIEYGEVRPGDSEADNKYQRAAAYFQEWLSGGVLVEDTRPAFYVHDHYFTYQGREYRRRGLACRVRLEEWASRIILPHENTFAAPRGERMRLLKTLGANTSPVLAMYRDTSREITRILAKASASEPIAASSSFDGERHELFAVSAASEVGCLERAFSGLSLYIADGHHRYESALACWRERAAKYPAVTADEPINFVLMTLVDMDDPKLLILPPHRLLRGLSPAKLAELEAGLVSFFQIERVVPGAEDTWEKVAALQGEGLCLVLVGPGDLIRTLAVRDFEAAVRLMPEGHSGIYHQLDVSLVDHLVLEEMLGLALEDEATVAFNYDRTETVQKIASGEFQLAFIVKPVHPGVIKDIADAQDRMPRKSTYFYPKLPSGLLINRVA